MSPSSQTSSSSPQSSALSPFARQFLAVSAGFLLGAAGTCVVQAEADLVLDASVKVVVDHRSARA